MLSDLAVGIARARELIHAANHIVVLTGAGISTDSGIPDFRGPNGVWTKNPAAEKTATLPYYLGDPAVRRRSWAGLAERAQWSSREPNAGHRALVHLEARGKLALLITQNVDGLHLKAGTSRNRLVEIHGTLDEVGCMSCGTRWPTLDIVARVREGEEDPPCEVCNGILKVAAISFGQDLIAADLDRSFAAARECDLMMAIGTSLAVTPIAWVVPQSIDAGARLIIVNNEATSYDRAADVVLHAGISDVLPQIVG